MEKNLEDRLRVPSKRTNATSNQPPDLYQIVIECRDEAQQRALFERLQREGVKMRLLVL